MKATPFALCFLALSTAAEAEEMLPLAEISQGNPEQTYQLVRCAAFYLANVEWAGQALGLEFFEQSKVAIADLLLVASVIRSDQSTEDVGHVAQMVNADTRAIADLYADNYRRNYALRGSAWDTNPVWLSDAEHCRPISEAASTLANELEAAQ